MEGQPVLRKRLLLVEDSDDDAGLFRRALRRSGIAADMEIVLTVEQTRSTLGRETFDLVVTDGRVGTGTASQVLAEVRAISPQVPPVVVLTGDASEVARDEWLHSGAAEVLVKPVDFDEFMASVSQLLRQYLA